MRPLRIKNFIGQTYLEDPDSVCDALIKHFEESDEYRIEGTPESLEVHRALSGDKINEALTKHKPHRRVKDVSVDIHSLDPADVPYVLELVSNMEYHKLRYQTRLKLRSYETFILEAFNLQKYVPPHDVYSGVHWEHCSEADIYNRRTFVWMVYLNDIKEGGETVFPDYDLKIKPRKGKLVIWPAYFTHKHHGLPTKEIKYIATGWYTVKLSGETPQELLDADRTYGLMHHPRGYFDGKRPPSHRLVDHIL